MPEDISSPSQPIGRFEVVLAEILQAEEQGRIIEVQRYCERFPELAERLREYFRNREHFARVAPVLAPTACRPAAPPAPPDLARGSQFAGYEILRELGRGGMGVIYLARQRSANRLVALKLIRKDRLEHLAPEQRQQWLIRFRTEGQAAARVANDRVVTVYEVGAHDGCPFYSMRYVEGRSLADKLKAGPLPNRPATILMEQVARAVQAVHEQKVLHRDLKPHNILVDARGRPYVTDFGLAKCSDATDSLTHSGDMLGSAHYMSPEQAQDSANVSEATDVYSLGATLYALLTGRPPFQGATVAEILHQVKYRKPDPPRRLNSAVARDLNTITLRCLEKEPGRRFPSAAAMADELQRYLEGRPILSRPVGPPGHLWRWCRRNPAFAALSAAAVVLLTLAGAMYWAYRSASGGAAMVEEHNRALEYLEDMPRTQRYLDGGELTKARELLARWRPEGGRIDHRAWEWHFLDAQCREAVFFKSGHQGQVQAVAWGPDGERLASADRQGNVRIWSVADGKDRDRPLSEMKAASGSVGALAWSPDGKRLAAVCQGMVQIWDADSYQEEPFSPLRTAGNSLHIPPQATGTDYEDLQILKETWIVSLTWSPNSNKLALVDANGQVQVCDLTKDKKVQLLGTHSGGVHSAVWSPDSDRLASVGGDGAVKVWEPPNPKPRDLTSPVNDASKVLRTQPSYALTWADNGKRLSVISGDGNLRILNATSGAEEAAARRLTPRDGLSGVGPMAATAKRFIWGPGGKLLASITPRTGDATIWDAVTGKEILLFRAVWGVRKPAILQGPTDPTGCSPAWDWSGRRLALGGDDGTIKAWNVGRGRRAVRTPILNVPSSCFAWSSDNQNVFCALDTAAITLLALQKERLEVKDPPPNPGIGPPPSSSPFPPGPGQPGVPSQIPRPEIRVCDAITGEVVRKLVTGVKPDILAESPDRKWLACATTAGLLQLWPAGGEQAILLEEPPKGGASASGSVLSWSPDSKRLAYSTASRTTIRLWDPNRRTEPVLTMERDGKPLQSLAWSGDNKRLASAGGGTVQVWDALSGKETANFPYFVMNEPPRFAMGGKTFVSSILSWCPGRNCLAVAGEDEKIIIWDVDAKKALRTLSGHASTEAKENHNVVCTVAWSPDGKRLASASPDGTFLLWDTANWKVVLTLRPTIAGPFAKELLPSHAGTLAWSPDGQQLAFFGGGGSVTIWDAAPEENKLGQEGVEPRK